MSPTSPSTELKLLIAPACDCCGSNSWELAFTENSIDLGRCRFCGLYYVAQMPDQRRRMTEMEKGHFGDNQQQSNAALHLKDETIREKQFQKYVDLARVHAPAGKWLDIGCGTGTLIRLVQSKGTQIEGIELTPDRRELAQQQTATTRIYDKPLEDLNVSTESFAAVTMINVFSHLISPTQTLREINRVLIPGGILLLVTGEIGEGAKKHHMFSWELGNHLYWLGEDTIRHYAQRTGFTHIFRDKLWQPEQTYRPERFRMPGRSRLRNAIKRACLAPGVFPLVRWYVLKKNRGNPVYTSTLILQKV